MDPRDDALAVQIGNRGFGGAQQQSAQMIDQHAVDLFRHSAIERAQARLEMRHRHMQLGRRQSAGQRRVGIAWHQHDVRVLGEYRLLNAGQHAAGHLPVAATVDVEIDPRSGDPELIEEYARHSRVEMLTGMQQHFLDVVARRNCARNRRDLYELWSCSNDHQYPEGFHASSVRRPGMKRACRSMQCRIVSALHRVHAIVSTIPSRSAVPAENPRCPRALLGSPKRWPERSQSRAGASAIGVGLPASSLISRARSRIVVSTPEASLYASPGAARAAQAINPLTMSSTKMKSRLAIPPISTGSA